MHASLKFVAKLASTSDKLFKNVNKELLLNILENENFESTDFHQLFKSLFSNDSAMIASNESDQIQSQILDWMQKGHSLSPDAFISLEEINQQLAARVYLVSNHLTFVDLFYYPLSHQSIKQNIARKNDFNHFYRWFDLIQHHIHPLEDTYLSKNYPLIPILNALPIETDKVQQPVTKESKKKKAPKESTNDSALLDDISAICHVDIRVGRIICARKHPDADSLYIENVDLGEECSRTIVSGLSGKIPLEEMQDRLAAFVVNLKPSSLRGVKSEGMILVGSSPDKSKFELLEVPPDAKPGDVIYVEGLDMKSLNPDPVLNAKKKYMESVQACLNISSNGFACFEDKNLIVLRLNQPLRLATLREGTIS